MSGFEIVGLLLATPQAIRDIIAFGRRTAEIVHDLNNPNAVADGLKSFNLESNNRKLQDAMEVSLTIYESPRYSADKKNGLDRDFQALQKAVKNMRIIADDFAAEDSVSRAWFKRSVFRDLAQADEQVRLTRSVFMDSIALVHVKDALLSNAKLESKWFSVNPNGATEVSDKIKVFHGHLTVKVGNVEPGQKLFLLEMRPYTADDKEEEEEKADELAKTLSSAQGASHILTCAGYYDQTSKRCMSIVFALPPEGRSFRSLGSFIQAPGVPVPALDLRINTCKQLAAAVLQVHTLQEPMVHKNINPENIVFFFNSNNAPDAISYNDILFLVNWHLSREAIEATNWKRPFGWWTGVYQHPTRQYPQQEGNYNLNHDIYSLGVCILEILIWKPLVRLDAAGYPERAGVLIESAPSLFDKATANLAAWNGPEPDQVCNHLQKLAQQDLLPIAGRKLSSIIVKCLKGLQDSQTGSETVATIFTSMIKEPLDSINI